MFNEDGPPTETSEEDTPTLRTQIRRSVFQETPHTETPKENETPWKAETDGLKQLSSEIQEQLTSMKSELAKLRSEMISSSKSPVADVEVPPTAEVIPEPTPEPEPEPEPERAEPVVERRQRHVWI
jgi:hypothetical protein